MINILRRWLSIFQGLGICDLGLESFIVMVMWDAFQ